MKRIFGAMLCVIFLSTVINAKNFSFLKKYFENNKDKYIIYIKKGEKKLYLINGDLDDIMECNVATGSENGKKICENDNRTPEGVYKITQIWQYEEPENLKNMKDELNSTDKKSKKYASKKKLYNMFYNEYLEG